jgi:UV DNA damage endonuclease
MTLSIGYCCINTELRKQDIFCSRTCRLATIRERGIGYSYELAAKNLQDLKRIIEWNEENKIKLYRMSSEMFPFGSHPDYYKEYDLSQFADTLSEIGNLAKNLGHTLTFHPGQYTQLSSHRPEVVEKSIVDLDFHAKIMDLMGLGPQSIIVIHGGSKNGGKEVALGRFKDSFFKLSESSQKRLVIENCEMAYSIEDLLPFSQETQIPIVLDYHHHNINSGSKKFTLYELTCKVIEVWKSKNLIPVFHISESKPGITEKDSITARRAHSDFVNSFPDELLKICETEPIFLDIEAKLKEQSVFLLHEKYRDKQLFKF